MVIGILKEPANENRVAALPEIVVQLKKLNFEVQVESEAGSRSYVSDAIYQTAGATISSRDKVLTSDLVLGIVCPADSDLKRMKAESVLIAVFQPLLNSSIVFQLLELNLTSFSMDMVPRTTRAQSMDVLSSQATVAGYKAVLVAANSHSRFFPMLMTAAGSIAPSKVLILGAGVAGLQAIATAKRLGAVVEVFDTRSAVKEEVNSLGAKFIEVEGAAESAAAGGYAIEQSKEFLERQKQKIHDSAVKSDIIITTAQIPGKKAPLLIPQATLDAMKPGSVIVDLASSTGGNCELTVNGETITTTNGITIIGNSNLPSTMPADASKMFGKNVLNFLKLILKDGQVIINMEDDIVKGTCITFHKEIINPRVREFLKSHAV
ncbi:MAG: Re/Si-specific NAD(P)(+) transhydrogenase subunit alpha [Chitinophagales bacterium]|nr:Re/Si-specific NAD(P)(+) transhydrogenase subunit alpha [Chitinophagales bacterium]